MNERLTTLGVCIPCYIKNEQDLTFLYRALESVRTQTLRPQELVLSDDSPKPIDSSRIKADFPELNIRVVDNSFSAGIAGNSNFGVSHLNTEWIHVLHQDDWLFAPGSYLEILGKVQELNQTHRWFLVTGRHEDGSHVVPEWKQSNLFGFNSIGGPSCLFVRNEDYIQFDERFKLLVDVKNYSDYFSVLGSPGIIENTSIFYGNPATRVSRNMTLDQTIGEIDLMFKVKTVKTEDVMECLYDSSLNPYHRNLLLKIARRNKSVKTGLSLRLSGVLFYSRLKLKLAGRF